MLKAQLHAFSTFTLITSISCVMISEAHQRGKGKLIASFAMVSTRDRSRDMVF